MKKIITLMLLLFPIAASAQLQPKVAMSFSTVDHFRLEDINGNKVTYDMPQITVRTGLEYRYKFVSVFYDNQFWCQPFKRGSFSPEEVHFVVGASVNITKDIKITATHTCWHPINSSGQKHVSLYGGNETITLSYGY